MFKFAVIRAFASTRWPGKSIELLAERASMLHLIFSMFDRVPLSKPDSARENENAEFPFAQ